MRRPGPRPAARTNGAAALVPAALVPAALVPAARGATALALALPLALAACTGGGDAREDGITVGGKFGTVPVVEFDPPLPIERAGVEVVQEGSGPVVEDEEPLVITLSAFHGSDGTRLEGAGLPRVLFATEEDLGPMLHGAIVGEPVGSRLLVTQPVEHEDDQEMHVTVVDILPTAVGGGGAAHGVHVTDTDHGPTIELEEGATPSGALDVTVLTRGEGEQVLPGQQVVLQYTIWEWNGHEVYDTTWDTGVPAVLELGTASPGVRTGILDQRTGSRLLIVVPPELGIGTDTLVVVVDVLAAG